LNGIGEGHGGGALAARVTELEAELARATGQLRVTGERLSAVVDAPVIVFAFDRDGIFTMSEGRRLDVLGLAPGEAVGRSVFDLYGDMPDVVEQCRRALAGEELLASGTMNDVVLETRYVPVRDATGQVESVVGITTDITERRRSEQEIAFLAFHDPLTGAANRARLAERLELAVRAAKRRELGVAVLFIDLDGFKIVNDSLGHSGGDIILRESAERLTRALRDTDLLGRIGPGGGEGDLLARHGGDEFVALLTELKEPAPAAAQAVAERLLAALDPPFIAGSHEFQVGASIGISVLGRDALDASALLENADAAMYQAKRTARGSFAHATVHRPSATATELTLSHRIGRALTSREFCLFYQPIVELPSSRATAVEALIRWKDPRFGWLSPGDFIPAAEQTGQIEQIGAWVIGEVCRCAKQWWTDPVMPDIHFNLSARELRSRSLITGIVDMIRDADLDPARLTAEITETALMTTADELGTLAMLRQAGLRIAIDDFGTGYSSLTRLKDLPVDTLKLDGSFLVDVPGDANATALLAAMIVLAKSLGMDTVAEGVETQEQLDFLIQQGCPRAQGYLIARPTPVVDLPAALTRLNTSAG
jgi:diguanylate cyclase (GGDEF)-like protein/PAS domain S-box-containing protein